MFMDHIVINAENVNLLMKFYTHVIGLKPERFDLYNQGEVQFPSIRINKDTIIDIFPKEMWGKSSMKPKGRPNLNHFCLAMSRGQWDNLNDRLKKAEVEIVNGPVNVWGSKGQGISIYFSDPEGNIIEAKHYEQ
jgi:glyoxylase I family protein